MPSRWDRLLETKPVPVIEHLVSEVAKLVAADLVGWPPSIGEIEPAASQQLEAVLAPGKPRPASGVFTESFRLARWELERETAAYDDYMRNRRWLQHGLAPEDKPALLFLCRWLVEQMLALGESTEGRVNRPRMLDCLERIERHLVETRA